MWNLWHLNYEIRKRAPLFVLYYSNKGSKPAMHNSSVLPSENSTTQSDFVKNLASLYGEQNYILLFRHYLLSHGLVCDYIKFHKKRLNAKSSICWEIRNLIYNPLIYLIKLHNFLNCSTLSHKSYINILVYLNVN